MKKIRRKSFVILVALLLAGCATHQLYTDGQGHTAICQASGFGIIGSIVANQAMSDCDQAMREAGYTKVEKETTPAETKPVTDSAVSNLTKDSASTTNTNHCITDSQGRSVGIDCQQ